MYITDTRPVTVNGFVVPHDHNDPANALSGDRRDTGGMIVCRMDNGAVVKTLQGALRGHGNYTQIRGNKGMLESTRDGQLRTWREPWEAGETGEVGELVPGANVYAPDVMTGEFEQAKKTGHGGGDFFTSYHFSAAIRSGEQPFLDVYRGVSMSIVGVLAWRSALSDGAPLEVPDFRTEEARLKYEDDHWSPDPTRKLTLAPEHQAPRALEGEIVKTPEALALAKEVWGEQGYDVEAEEAEAALAEADAEC
jgi:hypothetical protein